MFKTTPDSLDALKTSQKKSHFAIVPHNHPYIRILLILNAGVNPALTNQNDAIYNK
jgi:hypothetical protein